MLKYCLFVLVVLSLSACISNTDTVYFQNPGWDATTPQVFRNRNQEYRLQGGDVLSIQVKSLDNQFTEYLNRQSSNAFNNFDTPALFVNGYTIGTDGYINMPSIGRILVAGKTVEEIRVELQEIVETKVPNPSVFVTLISFKISVLGEVNTPGYYYIYNNQANILEALALAGDMLEFADRRNLSLIRQTKDGSIAIKMDLTDPAIFSNRYYFLQPNDVLYVPPLEKKNKRSNLAAIAVITAIGTVVTSGIAIYNATVNNNN